MDQSEGETTRSFRERMRWIGFHGGKRFTLHSYLYFLVGLANMSYLGYVILFTDVNRLKTAHFVILQYFYVGTLWTAVSKSYGIMHIARECDKIVSLRGEHVEEVYASIMEEVAQSSSSKALSRISMVAYVICPYICIEPILNYLFSDKDLEFPFTGSHEDPIAFVGIYILQCALMFIVANVNVTVFQTQLGSAINLVGKYQLMKHELSTLNVGMLDSTNVYKSHLFRTVHDCVQLHHNILKIFAELSEICTYGFRYSYLGLLGATTLSRSLLSGDNPDWGTLPHIAAELSYIGFFCVILDQLEQESNDIRNAIYACEWWCRGMPKEITSSLRIIMLRAEKTPSVVLYRGGGPANLDTFYKLLNGTCAYIIFGMILDQAL